MRRAVTFLKDSGGSITVEFLIMLPLILVAIVFVYDLGRAIWAYEIASQDVRAGLRYLSRVESVTNFSSSSSAVQAAINLAETGSTTTTANCPSNCHYPWTDSSSITVSAGCPTGGTTCSTQYNETANIITMQASVPISILDFVPVIGSDFQLTASITDTAYYVGD